jgi:hypothetical protein
VQIIAQAGLLAKIASRSDRKQQYRDHKRDHDGNGGGGLPAYVLTARHGRPSAFKNGDRTLR